MGRTKGLTRFNFYGPATSMRRVAVMAAMNCKASGAYRMQRGLADGDPVGVRYFFNRNRVLTGSLAAQKVLQGRYVRLALKGGFNAPRTILIVEQAYDFGRRPVQFVQRSRDGFRQAPGQ